MIMELQHCNIQLSLADNLITESENQSGAHPANPILMQDIFDLLQDRAALLNRISQLQDKIEEEVS